MIRFTRSRLARLAPGLILVAAALAACASVDEPRPLTLSGDPPVVALEGRAYEGFEVAAEGGARPYRYSLVGPWPEGISVDEGTGEVTGTPSEHGAFQNLTVRAEDAEGYTAALDPFGLDVLPILSLEPRSGWWATTPTAPLSEYGTLRVELLFVNDSGGAIGFDGDEGGNAPADELQIWTTPGVLEPAVTLEAWPEGTYADGESFGWTLVLDVGTLDASENAIAFRPVSNELGTMSPASATLESHAVTATDW